MSVVHVVLLRPKESLSSADRSQLLSAIEAAAREIPGVRRFRLGRRLANGPEYQAGMSRDFPYCALIEFDDERGLRNYLGHPAHLQLGAAFYRALDAASIADYDIVDATEVSTLDVTT